MTSKYRLLLVLISWMSVLHISPPHVQSPGHHRDYLSPSFYLTIKNLLTKTKNPSFPPCFSNLPNKLHIHLSYWSLHFLLFNYSLLKKKLNYYYCLFFTCCDLSVQCSLVPSKVLINKILSIK